MLDIIIIYIVELTFWKSNSSPSFIIARYSKSACILVSGPATTLISISCTLSPGDSASFNDILALRYKFFLVWSILVFSLRKSKYWWSMCMCIVCSLLVNTVLVVFKSVFNGWLSMEDGCDAVWSTDEVFLERGFSIARKQMLICGFPVT